MATLNRDPGQGDHNSTVLEPLILLHGDDPYLALATARELRDELCQDILADLNLEEFRAPTDLDELERSLASPPFLSIRRVVVIWDPPQFAAPKRKASARPSEKSKPDRLAASAHALLKVLAARSDTTATLVVVRQPLAANSVAVKGIRSLQGEVRAQLRPKGQDLRRYVERRCASRSLKLPPGALQLLVDVAGRDLGTLEGELDKLDLYRADGRPLTPGVARLLITAAPPQELYRLTDALFSEPASVGPRLESLWGQPGADPQVIVGALARVFRDLIAYSDPGGRQSVESLPSWRLERLAAQSSKAGAVRLRAWLSDLAELDWKTKTGQVDGRAGLEVFLASIAWELCAQGRSDRS